MKKRISNGYSFRGLFFCFGVHNQLQKLIKRFVADLHDAEQNIQNIFNEVHSRPDAGCGLAKGIDSGMTYDVVKSLHPGLYGPIGTLRAYVGSLVLQCPQCRKVLKDREVARRAAIKTGMQAAT